MSFKTAGVCTSRGCLASECLTMANLNPGQTLIWHPRSQAEACAAVSIALALQFQSERYLMPAELICCMWHLYSHSPVHFLRCLTLLCQHHLHSIQHFSLVIPPGRLTLPALHMQAPCPSPGGTWPAPACLAFNFDNYALFVQGPSYFAANLSIGFCSFRRIP